MPGSPPNAGFNRTPSTYFGQTDEPQLPPLQYDTIMKRASVQFSGQRDTLVFYNQLMNGLSPYGCY